MIENKKIINHQGYYIIIQLVCNAKYSAMTPRRKTFDNGHSGNIKETPESNILTWYNDTE